MRGRGRGRGEASAVAGSFGKDLMLKTGGSGVLAAPLLRNGCDLNAAISEPGRGLRFVFSLPRHKELDVKRFICFIIFANAI